MITKYRRRKSFNPDGLAELTVERVGLLVDADTVTSPYTQNTWVHAAVEAKANLCASVPLRIYTGKRGTKNKRDITDQTPFARLLNRPSPVYPTLSSLMFAASMFLDLYGEDPFIALGMDGDWNPGDVPAELYLANPAYLSPEIDYRSQTILRWRTRDGGVIPTTQMCLIKLLDPRQPYRGLSPLAASQLGLDFDYAAHAFNVALMRNGCDPGGIVSAPGVSGWDTDTVTRARSVFEDRHRGASKAGRVAFMDSEAKYTQLVANNKALQFMEAREWSKKEVKAVLRVTDFELGDIEDNASFATASASRVWLWQNSLKPRLSMIEDALHGFLFAPYSRREMVDVWAEFDYSAIPEIQEAFTSRLDAVAKLAPHYGINTISDKLSLDMPRVAWGDEPAGAVMPTVEGDVPVDGSADVAATAMNGAQVTSLVEIATAVATGQLPIEAGIGLILVAFPTVTEAQARRILSGPPKAPLLTRSKAAAPDGILQAASRYFAECAAIARDQLVVKSVGGGARLSQAFKSAARRIFAKPFTNAIVAAHAQLKKRGFEVIAFDKRKLEWLKRETGRMVRVAARDAARLKRVLTSAENITDKQSLAEAIDGFFHTQNSGRAQTIAQTENGFLQSQVQFQGYKDEGVESIQWTTSGSSNVRPTHAALDGDTVKIGERFSNGLLHPSEPGGAAAEVINCKCTVVPA